MGAFLYGIDPTNVSSVLQRIASNEPYTNFFTHPLAPNIFSLSFFGWTYIVGSFCSLCIVDFHCGYVKKIQEINISR